MKQIMIAVLRARHDPDQAFIPEQACLEMMMNNSHHTSLLNYWSKVTYGYIDFVGSTMFPWVNVSMASSDVSRGTQCTRAYDATKALPNADLTGFDGFVVLSLPGRMTVPNPKFGAPGEPQTKVIDFDGGATGVYGKPACALPVMNSNHTFMCHELGHVLGWRHSYGVLNNGIDWDGQAPFAEDTVYGDPYDIMSSATFGTRNLDPKLSQYSGSPVFQGHVVPGWPNLAAFSMGPAPARAHLHLWDPAAFAPERIRHFAAPLVGQKLRFTLTAALLQRGVQLAVLHPIGENAAGRGRVYVEYRQRQGWDTGLDESGNDLARQAVVVHALDDTLEGVRCWYRGRVLVPVELDSDVSLPNIAMHVRVLDADTTNGTVDVEVSGRLDRGVEIHVRGTHQRLTVIDPQSMSTPCGDTLTYGTWITETRTSYQPVSFGFAGAGAPDQKPLKASWSVGGVAIAGSSGAVDVPTTEGLFKVTFDLDPLTAELVLQSRGGERYRADVTLATSEADGSGTVYTTKTFEPKGWFEGYAAEDTAKLARCLSKYAKSARLRLRDALVPPSPDPRFEPEVDRLNQRRLQRLIADVAGEYPGPAAAMAALTALRYGVGNR